MRTALWSILFFEAGAFLTLLASAGLAWVVVFMAGFTFFMLLTRGRYIVFFVALLALPLAGFVAFWAACSGNAC